jgi:hypothetical protein
VHNKKPQIVSLAQLEQIIRLLFAPVVVAQILIILGVRVAAHAYLLKIKKLIQISSY